MKVIWSAKGYILIAVVCYLVTLLATVPLNLVWSQLKPHAENLPFQVRQVSGTVWSGQSTINMPQVGNVQANWQLLPSLLLFTESELRLTVQAQGLDLKAKVFVDTEQVRFEQTSGHLNSQLLRPALAAARVKLAGDFELTNFQLTANYKQPEILAAQGRILYSGGDVSFPIDGKMISSTVPLIIGDIQQQEDKVTLELVSEEQLSLGQGFLKPDGWAGIAIKRRFLDTIGQQWPGKANEDDVIFEVSEKVLR